MVLNTFTRNTITVFLFAGLLFSSTGNLAGQHNHILDVYLSSGISKIKRYSDEYYVNYSMTDKLDEKTAVFNIHISILPGSLLRFGTGYSRSLFYKENYSTRLEIMSPGVFLQIHPLSDRSRFDPFFRLGGSLDIIRLSHESILYKVNYLEGISEDPDMEIIRVDFWRREMDQTGYLPGIDFFIGSNIHFTSSIAVFTGFNLHTSFTEKMQSINRPIYAFQFQAGLVLMLMKKKLPY
jgi:hypothetical protein